MRANLLTLFMVCCHVLLAQNTFSPSSNKPIVTATAINRTLKTDGKLDEAEWMNTPVVSSFTQVEPGQGKPSQFHSQVKMLYNKKYLYISAFMADSLGRSGLRATDMKRDFNWRDHDTFAICIDGFNDKRNSMSLATNPYGAQKDYLSFDDTFFDSEWSGLWKVRTIRADSGWVAEFEIPWKTLRYAKGTDSAQVWGINFLRLKRSANEISVWSPYPRSFGFNRMEYVGVLHGIKPPAPSTNVQINPYLLFNHRKTEGTDMGDRTINEVKLGGELKWAINPNTVVDLTANTDFAQADADIQVNNVSRFSVFFPEKRQFFLENASLFSTGISPPGDLSGGNMVLQPFFSRRIGLASNGTPIPIDAGARLVYRSLKRNAGAITMRQREFNGNPLTHFFVGRYSENLGKRNRVGALFTMKAANGTDAKPSYTNALGGVDGFFRFGTAHSLQAMVMQTNTTDGKGNGMGGYAQYNFNTNGIKFWWTQSVVSKNFNPELGFVSRNDVISTTPGFFTNYRGRYLPYKKVFRSFAPGVTAEFYHQASTRKLIERNIALYPLWINFQNGAFISFSTSSSYQFLAARFIPLGVIIENGEYRYMRNSLSAGTDQSRKISLLATVTDGGYYDGQLTTTTASVNLIPIPHIALNFNFNQNVFRGVGLEETNRTINLYTVTGRFALNPRVQLIGLYQKNTQDNKTFYNVRLAWEFKPLAYVYIVLNNRTYTNITPQMEQTGVVKFTYMKQF